MNVAETTRHDGGAGRLAGRRILLVEDAPMDQRLVASLLMRAGAEVVLECSGQAAVERAFPRRGGPAAFDAVLMDLMMSPVDGAEAAATLREQGFDPPIVIMTASTDPADAARCGAAGCDRLLSKPVAVRELIETVAESIAARRAAPAAG